MNNIEIRKSGLIYIESEGTLVPSIHFYIELKKKLGVDELNLYFDGKGFSGDKIGVDGWIDMDEDELKLYGDYIMKYDGIIECTEDIVIALNYFNQNKLCTTGLKFISKTKDGHFAIDCTYSDWYGEYFKTKKKV